MGTFVQAVVIIVREGLEALMLVTALITYSSNIGRPDHVRAIYAGTAAAIASSIGLAWIFHSALATLEQTWAGGLLILGAAVLMLYVSGWLFIQRGAGTWQKYLHAKAEDASHAARKGTRSRLLPFSPSSGKASKLSFSFLR